ncbi:MAG: hypothetical protein PHD67_03175, partial [Oscillospiraceae bacterium]|nr:hypothetical protein [Oscillospiraceae bacterium]
AAPVWNDGAATLPSLGISFPFPSSWAALSPEETAAVMNGAAGQEISGAEKVSEEDLQALKDGSLLVIQTETGDLMQFTVLPAKEPDDLKAYVEGSVFLKASTVLTGLSEVKEADAAGVPFCTFTGEYPSQGMAQRYWVACQNGWVVQITCSTQGDLGEMEDIFFAAEPAAK